MAAQINRRVLTCIYAPEAQTIGNKKISLTENHDWKTEAQGKTKEYHSLGQATLRYLKSAEGLYRIGQLGERVPKLTNAVRQEYNLPRLSVLDTCTSKSLSAWTWLTTIPRTIEMTPGVLGDVKEAKNALSDPTLSGQQVRYKFEKAFREATDLAAMSAYSVAQVAGLFPSMAKFTANTVTFAEGSTLVHDVTSLKINGENYIRGWSIDLAKATPAMKETVERTRSYNLIALAKDVSSVASGFFGLLFVATGMSVLPGIAFATLALASTIFAVIRKLYEETMTYKPISYLDNKHVTLVSA